MTTPKEKGIKQLNLAASNLWSNEDHSLSHALSRLASYLEFGDSYRTNCVEHLRIVADRIESTRM